MNESRPILATLATVATGASWLANANEVITLLVGLATLAWWLRLWLKNPNVKPPKVMPKKQDESPD